ncbi:conserved exported protein of unknown function [Listeria monocytogenes]|nr:conserved exported protein of unknown function [Listeria monocytogenes]
MICSFSESCSSFIATIFLSTCTCFSFFSLSVNTCLVYVMVNNPPTTAKIIAIKASLRNRAMRRRLRVFFIVAVSFM